MAYRVRVSVQNMFVVKNSDGVLDSNSTCLISVVLKPSTKYSVSSEIPDVKFAIELIEVDQRYLDLGSKTFWSRYSPEGIRKVISTFFSISPLKSNISKRRANSPNRVKWADEKVFPQETTLDSNLSINDSEIIREDTSRRVETIEDIVMSPRKSPASLAKHLKHIAEMEDMLQALKVQLENEEFTEECISVKYDNKINFSEPTLENIIGISSALLDESTKLVKSDMVTEQKVQYSETEQIEESKFQPQIQPILLAHKPQLRPRGRIFELLIKNVSRDAALSPEEVEVMTLVVIYFILTITTYL